MPILPDRCARWDQNWFSYEMSLVVVSAFCSWRLEFTVVLLVLKITVLFLSLTQRCLVYMMCMLSCVIGGVRPSWTAAVAWFIKTGDGMLSCDLLHKSLTRQPCFQIVGISATGKKCDWQCIDYEVLLPYCRLRCDGLKLCRYIAYCWWNFAVLCCVRRWSFCCWSRSIWSHWRMVECLTHCTAFVMSWRRSSLTPSESISSACECWTGSVVVIVIIISCSFACCHNVNWSRLHWNQPPMFSLVISNTESSQSQPVIQTHRVNWLNLTFSQLAVKMLDLISLLDVFVCDWLALWWLHVTDDKAEHWTLISLQNCNLD